MKVLIVGAGIIGTTYGWALSRGGHEVMHLVRSRSASSDAMSVRVDMLDGRRGHHNTVGPYLRPVITASELEDIVDLVIVPTKPYQLTEAIRSLVPVTPSAQFLLLTQNWVGTEQIDALLARDRYIFGDAHAGGVFDGGTLVATLFPEIVLGQLGGGTDSEALAAFRTLFESIDLAVVTPPDVLHYIWVQYAINAGLWTGLVRCGGLKPLLRDRANGPLSLRAVNECLDVVEARGVNLANYPDSRTYRRATSRTGMMIAELAMRAMFTCNAKVKRASAHGLGDPREIAEAFNAVLRTGKDLGVDMPTMHGFAGDIAAFAGASE
jgi:2-dehydropantoate 2-reductase